MKNFKSLDICCGCREPILEYVMCDTCAKRLCEDCSAATPMELQTEGSVPKKPYRCVSCYSTVESRGSFLQGEQPKKDLSIQVFSSSKPKIPLLYGRNKCLQSRERALECLWKAITGQVLSDAVRTPLRLSKPCLVGKSGLSEAFCRAVANSMRAGFEEVAQTASWAVARINFAYNKASLPMPSAALDLVYLMNGESITWKLVELAAASFAHVEMAPLCRKRKESVRALQGQPLPTLMSVDRDHEDKRVYNVGFWSHDLYRRSATLDLVGDIITRLDGWADGRFRVFVYSIEAPEGNPDPSVQSIIQCLKKKGSYRAFRSESETELIRDAMLADRLDHLIHLPGFNNGAIFKVLACRPAKSVSQWLGCAGPTYAVEGSKSFIDYCLCSLELWKPSIDSERAAFLDCMYPLPYVRYEKMPMRDSEMARYFGLPEGRRRLCFPGTPKRLRRETIVTALHMLKDSGHGPESPVLCILSTFHESMLTSVMCWAEEWRMTVCPEFDIERILPYRFIIDQVEYHWFLAQMDLFLDCFPCGLHTSLLEPLNICKVIVVWLRLNASWPSLVASSVLIYGGYGDLVVNSEVQLVSMVVDFLTSETKIQGIEHRMLADRASGRGIYHRDRILYNLEIAIPAMVNSVERAGGDRQLLKNIDLKPFLPPMQRGGGPCVVAPETPVTETPEARCERVLCKMISLRDFGGRVSEARKVLLFAERHGLSLLSPAGAGGYAHAVRGVYMKEGNRHVPKGSHVIFKLMHGGRGDTADGKRWRQIRRISADPNFCAVEFMDIASTVLARSPNSRYVTQSKPIFSSARGSCSAGYLAFDSIGPAAWAMTFHCCEAMSNDLYNDENYQRMVAEFRRDGYISRDRNKFEQGLFHMLDTLHSKHMFIMDLSLGNLALRDGLPVLIDAGNSVVLRSSTCVLAARHATSGPESDEMLPSGQSWWSMREAEGTAVGHSARPDADGFVLFTSGEVRTRVNSTKEGNRRLIGFGTRGCRSEQMVRELKDGEKTSSRNRRLSNLTPEFAAHFDISAAAMILAQGYVPIEKGRMCEAWLCRLEAATRSTEAMYDFLCTGLEKGVKPKQTHALFRRADMLHRLLGVHWQKQPTADDVLHHPAFTLPSHTDSLLLQLDCGIRLEGGQGKAPAGCWWAMKYQPAVLFKTDGSNGTGVIACEDVAPGEYLGQYAGKWVPDSCLEAVADLPVSRYTVSRATDQNKKTGSVLGESDFEWCFGHSSAGSFMNAGSGADINVVIDRSKAWTDGKGTCWLAMRAGPQGVKKGQRLLWKYCPWSSRGIQTVNSTDSKRTIMTFLPDVPRQPKEC